MLSDQTPGAIDHADDPPARTPELNPLHPAPDLRRDEEARRRASIRSRLTHAGEEHQARDAAEHHGREHSNRSPRRQFSGRFRHDANTTPGRLQRGRSVARPAGSDRATRPRPSLAALPVREHPAPVARRVEAVRLAPADQRLGRVGRTDRTTQPSDCACRVAMLPFDTWGGPVSQAQLARLRCWPRALMGRSPFQRRARPRPRA